MYKSTFYVEKMDCPCEVNLIRMTLNELTGIQHLEADLAQRRITILHTCQVNILIEKLQSLALGTRLESSEQAEESLVAPTSSAHQEKKLLITVLMVNAIFFLIESVIGFLFQSMGLMADALDMLADALVYGMALIVVGKSILHKQRIAQFSGYIQITLAIIGIIEVLRRYMGAESYPSPIAMATMSFLALVGNAYCLWLLQRNNSQEAHMRASLIFSANDVLINIGIIFTALAVWLTGSPLPDLIIGTVVFVLVLRGAWRILQIAK